MLPKGEEQGWFRALEAWETWEEPPLVEHARVLSSLREAPPKHAGPQRVPRELRKKLMTWADMNCSCKGGHQQVEDEVLPPPGRQDGEWEVKVSKKNQTSQKQRKREQAERTPPQVSPTARVPQSSLKMFMTSEPDHGRRLGRD